MKTKAYLIAIMVLIAFSAFKVDVTSTKKVKSKVLSDNVEKAIALHSNVVAIDVPPQATAHSTPLLRYWNNKLKRHYFTSDPNDLGAGKNDWVFEKTVGWLLNEYTGTPLLHSFYNSSTSTFYYSTINSAPPGFIHGGILGKVNHPPYAAGVPVTEYKTPDGKDYMYVTTTDGELLSGWTNNGVVFALFANPIQ